MKTAVLLITFNRLDYVKETLKAISVARPPRIYLASDGPRPHKVGEDKIVQEVRDYMLSHINWPCEIHTRFLGTNSGGCKYGVSGAVSWFFNNEPEGIILEDDCVADPTFFTFCEELLEKYRENKKIWHIAGDAPIETDISASYYFAKIQHCWGWASWADRWQYFSLDVSNYGEKEIQKFSKTPIVQEYWRGILTDLKNNLIDTWDYQWTLHILANDGMCINPAHNLISNIGEQGVHYNGTTNELLKPTISISALKHPKKIKLNEKLINQIYSDKFNIPLSVLTYKFSLFGKIPLFTWRVQ